MKIISILICYLLFSSCNSQNKKKSTSSNHISAPIYIDVLRKFIDSDEYFIPINFNIEMDDYGKIARSISKDTIFKSKNELRIKIEESGFPKYLKVDLKLLNTLFVFNENQELIDSLFFKRYELYEHYNTYQQRIVSYNGDLELENKIVISEKLKNNKKFKKSPRLILTDFNYKRKLLTKVDLISEDIDFFGYTTHKADTISIVSYYDILDDKLNTYLFKNSTKKDSLKSFGTVREIIPVPIAQKTNFFYLMKFQRPFDDKVVFFTDLVEIDLKHMKLILHSNRKK